jgi:uncharacterized membrane protein YkoI
MSLMWITACLRSFAVLTTLVLLSLAGTTLTSNPGEEEEEATVVFAQKGEKKDKKDKKDKKAEEKKADETIPLIAAISIAEQKVKGKAVKAELKGSDGDARFNVEFLDKGGEKNKVTLNYRGEFIDSKGKEKKGKEEKGEKGKGKGKKGKGEEE